MEKVATNFDFSKIEKILENMDADHSASKLNMLKNEVNKFFFKSKCMDIIYTDNTDKFFFGMKVYAIIKPEETVDILGDKKPQLFAKYRIELDSKLFDPMLGMTGREYTAILLHEIGHIVYDTGTIDAVKNQMDIYFAKSGDSIDLSKLTTSYKQLLAYAIQDSCIKVGSIFALFGNEEIVADEFVVACGYGPDLESGMRKVLRSSNYMTTNIDNRLITMAWVLRLHQQFQFSRIPVIKTLNKAKELTASELEKKELSYALNIIRTEKNIVEEGAFDNVKARFSDKFLKWKSKGMRAVKNEVYELNLRMRTAEIEEDLMYVIRTANTDIAILNDYMMEDISDAERKECEDVIQQLYEVRQKAAKEKEVRDGQSLIQVVYTN